MSQPIMNDIVILFDYISTEVAVFEYFMTLLTASQSGALIFGSLRLQGILGSETCEIEAIMTVLNDAFVIFPVHSGDERHFPQTIYLDLSTHEFMLLMNWCATPLTHK
jgi:hypothetical protein